MNTTPLPAASRVSDVEFGYRVALRSRNTALRHLIDAEMAAARRALEALRLLPPDACVEALNIALIVRHHRDHASRLRKELHGLNPL